MYSNCHELWIPFSEVHPYQKVDEVGTSQPNFSKVWVKIWGNQLSIIMCIEVIPRPVHITLISDHPLAPFRGDWSNILCCLNRFMGWIHSNCTCSTAVTDNSFILLLILSFERITLTLFVLIFFMYCDGIWVRFCIAEQVREERISKEVWASSLTPNPQG